MNGEPHTQQTDNSFRAVLKASQSRTVNVTESEYEVIKALRKCLDIGKHHQMMIGYRDGKYLIYHVSLSTTFAADK